MKYVREYFNRLGFLIGLLVFQFAFVAPSGQSLHADDGLQQAIRAVCTVDINGKGHAAAVPAMKVVNAASIEQVPAILMGMDGANQLAANWLRSAVISIVNRDDALPRREIETFFADTSHSHLGRLLAFELLTDGDAALAEKMISDLIDDPSLPLRAKAIAAEIEKAKSSSAQTERLGMLIVAFNKARDVDQVQEIAKLLDENGVAVDLAKQLGFLTTWNLVGSFDNKDQAGFDVAQGPEENLSKLDLKSSYSGLDGEPSKWSKHTTSNPLGVMNLNQLIGSVKGASVYAHTQFEAADELPVELRIGSPNATKIWLNGELVMSNEIYHNSNSVDKFSGSAKLKKGQNELLVKICQNEQTDSWAQDWEFQLRVCDASGKAVEPIASR